MVSMGTGVGIIPQLVLEKSSLKNEVEILTVFPELQPFIVGACTTARNRNNTIVQSFWKVVSDEKNLLPANR